MAGQSRILLTTCGTATGLGLKPWKRKAEARSLAGRQVEGEAEGGRTCCFETTSLLLEQLHRANFSTNAESALA